MTEVTISDRDMQVLDIIARGEAVQGSDPYNSLWPNTTNPQLSQLTLAEVLRFQEQRRASGIQSEASGRYQFMRPTLQETIATVGVNPIRVRFTPDVQDALIKERIRYFRQYSSWLDGSLTTDRFMIKLAQEFASMPVPYNMTKPNGKRLLKGQSYYADGTLNRAKHDTDTLYQELEDILASPAGNVRIVSLDPAGPNTVLPAAGTSPRAQTANRAAGQGVGAYVGGNAGARPLQSTVLPAATGAVYQYRTIDPLDDRYDFRTGEKIKDLSIHGTAAAAQTPIVNGNIGLARVATTNSGVESPVAAPEISDEQLSRVAELQSNISDAVGNILTDPTSIIANIAERAKSLINTDALNSALTGRRTTDTDSFDSAVTTSSQATDQAATAPNRSNPPRPISGSNRGPQQ